MSGLTQSVMCRTVHWRRCIAPCHSLALSGNGQSVTKISFNFCLVVLSRWSCLTGSDRTPSWVTRECRETLSIFGSDF